MKKFFIFGLCTFLMATGAFAFLAGGGSINPCASSLSTSAAPGAVAARAGPERDQIVQAAIAVSKGDPLVAVSMVAGSYLETRLSVPHPGGPAFGAWQIEMPGIVHLDITEQQAENIPYAAQYMYPAYAASVRRVNPDLWKTDPVTAVEQAVHGAEHPAQYYSATQGRQTVADALNTAIALLQKAGMPVDLAHAYASQQTLIQETAAVTQLSNNTCRGNGSSSNSTFSKLMAYTGATGVRQAVLKAAAAELGVPYSWGGGNAQGPTYGICASGAAAGDCGIKGFDCSGLTLYSFAQVGVNLPRTAAAQWNATRNATVVPRGGNLAAAQPGDLVFFSGSDGTLSSPGHVGIYIGDGQMINAPQSGENVKIVSITTQYWQDSFVGITDPFALAA